MLMMLKGGEWQHLDLLCTHALIFHLWEIDEQVTHCFYTDKNVSPVSKKTYCNSTQQVVTILNQMLPLYKGGEL